MNTFIYIYICIHLVVHRCVYIYIYIFICPHSYLYLFISLPIPIYLSIYLLYIYLYISIYIYIYVCISRCLKRAPKHSVGNVAYKLQDKTFDLTKKLHFSIRFSKPTFFDFCILKNKSTRTCAGLLVTPEALSRPIGAESFTRIVVRWYFGIVSVVLAYESLLCNVCVACE